jgi:hypothetical protein
MELTTSAMPFGRMAALGRSASWTPPSELASPLPTTKRSAHLRDPWRHNHIVRGQTESSSSRDSESIVMLDALSLRETGKVSRALADGNSGPERCALLISTRERVVWTH